MNSHNWLLIKGGVVLLFLWLGIFSIIKVAGSMKPTPEKIMSYAQKNPLDKISDPEQRKKVIGKVAEMVNQLEGEDLKEFGGPDGEREMGREWYRSMSPEEQWYFMEKRMGRAFTQMMEIFNQMEREERKTMVTRSLERMRKDASSGDNPDGPRLDFADPEMVEKIATAGMEAYFKDASAETKMDLAPLMEKLQETLSAPGRGPRSRNREERSK